MHDELIERRIRDFHGQNLNCAETVLTTTCEALGVEGGFYPRIATAFGGGLAGTQGLCGALSGALMVIGLMRGREVGGDKSPAYDAGKEFIAWFNGRYGCSSCRDLTGLDLSCPEQRDRFRAPDGKHATLCEPMVAEVIRELIRRFGN